MGAWTKGEGIKKYKFVVTKYSWGYKILYRKYIDNVALTMHGASWVLEISREYFVKYMIGHLKPI